MCVSFGAMLLHVAAAARQLAPACSKLQLSPLLVRSALEIGVDANTPRTLTNKETVIDRPAYDARRQNTAEGSAVGLTQGNQQVTQKYSCSEQLVFSPSLKSAFLSANCRAVMFSK